MRFLLSLSALALAIVCFPCGAAAQPLVFDGTVPDGPETHFFVPFEVPAGVVEIEVRHDDLSAENILDFGLEDPHGFRGWGGGNTEPAVVGLDAASRSYVPGPIDAGTWRVVEIEVRHDDLSAENILDFGLEDPHGFRGWGGGNTEPAVVGLDAASRSYVPGPIDAGTWRVVVGKAKVNELPGSYHIEIELRTEPTLAPQPERTPYVDPGVVDAAPGWYAGDFHVHSRESGDAAPTLDAIAELVESRGLRFVEISDHNTNTALDFFEDVRARHPSVLFVPGVEFTTYAGHANGIGATEWVNHRIGVEGATIDEAIDAFHAQGALFSLNHPKFSLGDLCIGCGWDHDVPPEAIDAIEIMTTSTSTVRTLFLTPTIALWDQLCDTGRHVAPIGGSDDHTAGEGTGSLASPVGNPTTVVEAENLSVPALLEGIRRGRTVVKIPGVDAPMAVLDAIDPLDGDTIVARRTTLVATITGGADHTLRVVKNGDTSIDAIAIDADPFRYEIPVEAPDAGEDRYRLEVLDGGSRVTVTSHVWVKRPSGGRGGCSAASEPDASWALVGLLVAGFVIARRAARQRSIG